MDQKDLYIEGLEAENRRIVNQLNVISDTQSRYDEVLKNSSPLAGSSPYQN